MSDRVNLLDAMRQRGYVGTPAHAFKTPVRVKSGIGLTMEVKNVQTASEELLKWPESARRAKWRKAAATCLAALEGGETPAAARKAFEAVAREAGMLLEW